MVSRAVLAGGELCDVALCSVFVACFETLLKERRVAQFAAATAEVFDGIRSCCVSRSLGVTHTETAHLMAPVSLFVFLCAHCPASSSLSRSENGRFHLTFSVTSIDASSSGRASSSRVSAPSVVCQRNALLEPGSAVLLAGPLDQIARARPSNCSQCSARASSRRRGRFSAKPRGYLARPAT